MAEEVDIPAAPTSAMVSPDLSALVIPLLKGVSYQEADAGQWNALLALLRKKLAEFDASGGDTRLVLACDEVAERRRVFLRDGRNEARLIDQIDFSLGKAVELGFLCRLKVEHGQRPMVEVRRILKAFVDAQWLAEFDQRLAAYRSLLPGPKEATDE